MKKQLLQVKGREITILNQTDGDFISLTDMMEAKDGDFFHFGLAPKPQYGRISGYLGVCQ